MHITEAAYIIGSLGGRPIKYPKHYRGGGYAPYFAIITFDSTIITFDSSIVSWDQ